MSENLQKLIGVAVMAVLVVVGVVFSSNFDDDDVTGVRNLFRPVATVASSSSASSGCEVQSNISSRSRGNRRVPSIRRGLPGNPSACQQGTLQGYDTDGTDAFVEHVELAAQVFPMKHRVGESWRIPVLCNYLPETCKLFDQGGWHNSDETVWDNEAVSWYFPPPLTPETKQWFDSTGSPAPTAHVTDSAVDKYLSVELLCPDTAVLNQEDGISIFSNGVEMDKEAPSVEGQPRILLHRNNKFAVYAFSEESADPRPPWSSSEPWSGFPPSRNPSPEAHEESGTEFVAIARPWITDDQDRLGSIYQRFFDDVLGPEANTMQGLDAHNLFDAGSGYTWATWLSNWLQEQSPKYKFYWPSIIEEYLWRDANPKVLAPGFDTAPPDSKTFWAFMRDFVETVPETVSSTTLVRIFDSEATENHWALVNAHLSYRTEQTTTSASGHCSADVTITRSYE